MSLVANARMYSVAPAAAAAWRTLLQWVIARADVPMALLEHGFPTPINDLWDRDDLGCVFMCGWPFAERAVRPRILAAPVPSPARYGGRPVYFSDLVVRDDSPFQTIEDTFGKRVAYTVEDSHSGYSALRHHLLAYRTTARPTLYAERVGPLVTPKRILEAVRDGKADIGPVDSYAHDLLKLHDPAAAAGVRVIASTAATPIPLLVARPDLPADMAARLTDALLAVGDAPELAETRAALLLRQFVRVDPADYDVARDRARAAIDAGYAVLA
jgi:ABC-type phosphate/phosphonate transport system substrate-binding protein